MCHHLDTQSKLEDKMTIIRLAQNFTCEIRTEHAKTKSWNLQFFECSTQWRWVNILKIESIKVSCNKNTFLDLVILFRDREKKFCYWSVEILEELKEKESYKNQLLLLWGDIAKMILYLIFLQSKFKSNVPLFYVPQKKTSYFCSSIIEFTSNCLVIGQLQRSLKKEDRLSTQDWPIWH